MPDENGFDYYAEAFALEVDLKRPIVQRVCPLGEVKLPKRGGYLFAQSQEFRVGGLISFGSAYTQVAGSFEPEHAWTVLATSVLKDFRILDVVTADRVVAQIFAEYPLDLSVPKVSFLGTRFENLRIAGRPLHIDLDDNLFQAKPEKNTPYSTNKSFQGLVESQCDEIQKNSNLPQEISQRYDKRQLPWKSGPERSIECSLVKPTNLKEDLISGQRFGHLIDIPYFGKILLAVVRLKESQYQIKGVPYPRTVINLTMIETRLGSPVQNNSNAGGVTTNGQGAGQ